MGWFPPDQPIAFGRKIIMIAADKPLIRVVGEDALMTRHMRIYSYSAKKVSEMLGIDQRSLAYWVDSKVVPDNALHELGKGARREFTISNLIQIAIIKELDRWSVHTKTMKRVLDALDESGYFDRLSNSDREHEIATIYINEDGYVELKNGNAVSIEDFRSLIQINLPRLEVDVGAAIEKARDGQGDKA